MTKLNEFNKLASSKKVKKSNLSIFYNSLESIKITQVKGTYKGGYWKTGSFFGFLLGFSKWHGKEFKSKKEVYALVHQFKKQGKLIKLFIGKATLKEKTFQNKTSTAMVYKYLPITDYFRKIDNNTLMGAMTLCGCKRVVLYFYLKK